MTARTVAIVWKGGQPKGSIEVVNGTLAAGRIAAGRGTWSRGRFAFRGDEPSRLEITATGARTETGALATRVEVRTESNPFTFFLRDVSSQNPIVVALYGVAVVPADDLRTYERLEAAVRARGLQTAQQQIETDPEETFEEACRTNRKLVCPTWLGLSRDMRFFEVGYSPQMGYWGYVQPRYHSTLQSVPETDGRAYSLGFVLGPGASCRVDITRCLEEGVLPILHSVQREDDVSYHLTAFATLETRPLSLRRLRGSEWRACYPNTGGNMLKPEDREELKDLLDAEMRSREEETVCWVRARAVNAGRVPRYAWFRSPHLQGASKPMRYNGAAGHLAFESGRVAAVCRLDGRPAPEEELAILLPPGGEAIYDMLIPHQPVSGERAARLAESDYDRHVSACREFWKGKLAAGASISVPEAAVDERIRAGLLHCDVVALGREPAGPVLATIGWYSPIGSESSPIIQFFDSMGWHKLAERSLEFFLARQREDGFIQNFGGYQLETGPALWSMGEHYRYTRNDAWVRRIRPKLLKACDYLLAWRKRNQREELRGKGYGLLDGKVADPEDFFHSFMLNGLSCVGIQRVAEMLRAVDPSSSRRLAREARAFRADIRASFYESVARSPAIPIGDGTWIPSVPPWSEYAGPLALYADGGKWFTHGAAGARDSLIGALYLVISEVLEPREVGTEILLQCHQELFTVRNAGLSQPYYCRHDFIHIARGESKAFLKTYYNQFTALQDRETYTFWEHYFHASQHKTHEEGWFLMQTRWMLWREEGSMLRLLTGIPRRWTEDGKRIELRNVASHFGPLNVQVESRLVAESRLAARIECRGARRPSEVVIRLPHPERRRPRAVTGGVHDPATETVRIASFKGAADVTMEF